MDRSAVGPVPGTRGVLNEDAVPAEIDTWQPDTYARFAAERRQPFFDLLDLVAPIPGGRAADLGCGTGELTRELHLRTGAAETLGLDSSEAMLAKAAPFVGDGLRFERGDIADFAPAQPYDLVFSNAAYHWVPDHPRLLERLTRALKPGGQLAFQVPDNFRHPSHRAAEAASAEEPYRSAMGGGAHPRNVLAAEAYASLLNRFGYREQTVRLLVYGHRLESREDVVAWVEGSLLSEYRRRLPSEVYAQFVGRYREILFTMVPDERPYFFTFRRILARARR
jgi:trans-aconitate 2-methyltransferase